ncbi:MAG: hypothetical protein ACK5Z4_07310, partial [Planctomyces sp.]
PSPPPPRIIEETAHANTDLAHARRDHHHEPRRLQQSRDTAPSRSRRRAAVFFRHWGDARAIIAEYPDRSRLSILVGWPYDPPAMDATVFVGYSIDEIPEDLRDLAR